MTPRVLKSETAFAGRAPQRASTSRTEMPQGTS